MQPKQGGLQKQQFKKGAFNNQPQQRRQNVGQFRPRGQFVRNFNQGRPQQQFRKMNFMTGGGMQKRNQGQFMTGNRQNFFNQRRQLAPFAMQRNFTRFQQQQPMFRRNMMQQTQMFQPRRFQQRNMNFGQMRFQQNRPMFAMRQQNQGVGGMRQQQSQATKLYISNLDFGVTNQDVKELFSEFGPMVRYGVNHSAAGRSVGSAEVFFKNKISAIKAMQKYNGVTLDGRPMKLEIAGGGGGGGSPAMQSQQRMAMMQPNRPMMQRRLPQRQMMNKMNMKFVPQRRLNMKAATHKMAQNSAAKKIVAQAAMRRAMKSKMVMGKKKVAPNVEQLDADLEAYAASKD